MSETEVLKGTKRPVLLCVRDGWGSNPRVDGNAVVAASTPIADRAKTVMSWMLLDSSGEAVGLPNGFQGSSEVGHLNMGAGRIVTQELKRIDLGFEDGSLWKSPNFVKLVENWKKNKSTLHLMGLLQDEGVHAHEQHLYKIMTYCRKEFPEGKMIIHPFLDGRDTPPRSTIEYILRLQKKMEETGNCSIGSFAGRYYPMDRSQKWELIDKFYHAMVLKEGRECDDIVSGVKQSYENDRTPDGVPMFDEYIPPYFVKGYPGVQDGDCIFHTNYRQDRGIQLSRAFVDPNYPGKLKVKRNVTYLGFTRYYDEFENYLMGAMSSAGGMDNLLGEVISKAGMNQLRIAEEQKFRHVTSFFNGKSTTPYSGEDQVQVKGRFDPATFALHPEMEAYLVTEEILKRLEEDKYDFILVNFANGDMVGHTGVFDAAKKAIEVVDECVGRLCREVVGQRGGVMMITADHGNADQMIDYDTGGVKTSHSMWPVEFIVCAKERRELISEGLEGPHGKLADIAPTVLKALNLPIPKEMTATCLLK